MLTGFAIEEDRPQLAPCSLGMCLWTEESVSDPEGERPGRVRAAFFVIGERVDNFAGGTLP